MNFIKGKAMTMSIVMSSIALVVAAAAIVMQIGFNRNLSAGVEKRNLSADIENRYGFSMYAKAGDTLYLSGITGHSNGVFSDSPEEQYRTAYANIIHALEVYGVSADNIVFERVFYTEKLKSMDTAIRRNIRGEVYKNSFPASTWIEVVALDSPGAVVEIEVIVMLTAVSGENFNPFCRMKGLVSTEIPFCSSHNIDYVVIGQSF